MSIEILDCLKRERGICVKNVIPSQTTAFIDHFHKWRLIMNYFESIKIGLTNLILKLVIQKNFTLKRG